MNVGDMVKAVVSANFWRWSRVGFQARRTGGDVDGD